jgi:outer membrane protein
MNGQLRQGGFPIKTLTTLVVAALIPTAGAAQTLSLADALDAALHDGLPVEVAALEKAQGRQALAEGIVTALPSLSASYTTSGETLAEVGDTWGSNFSLTQPLVDAGVVFSVVRGVRENQRGKAAAAQTVADLILKVETSYYALAQAQALVASAEKQNRRAADNLALVAKRSELGEATRADKLEAEANALSKENALAAAENDVRKNQRELSDLMGYDAWEAVAVEALPAPESPANLATTVITETTLAKNPDLALLQMNLKTADLAYWGAWANNLPALSFSVSRGTTTGTSAASESGQTQTRYGLGVSFPIVDVPSRVVEITGARLDREESRLTLAQAKVDTRQRLAELLAAQELAYRQWETASKTLEMNEEAYRLKTRSYELGDASQEDVLLVEANLAEAEQAQVEANASYWSNRAELNYLLGVSLEAK